MVNKIILGSPRGFCAGVERAIKILDKALEIHGKPIYVRHQIIHNEHVVKSFEERGVIFIESLDEVPNKAYLVFSAHGTPPKVKQEAEQRGLKYIDAVCPLVNKVHIEAQRYHKQGYHIILIGHKGHQEVIGTMGHAPMTLVGCVKDVKQLNIDNPKIAFLTQTTLSVDETKGIIAALKKKYPKIKQPPKEDICYATTNRQKAVKEIAKQADLILIIGSKKSSNCNRLMETAQNNGVDSYLVADKSGLKCKLPRAKA